MVTSNTSDSPLEQTAGEAGLAAILAFSLLGNETRLAILLALWEAYKPHRAENAVSFSDLQERVGISDSGQFNYHLEKLVGYFVMATDGGYLLRQAGLEVVQTVISGTGLQKTPRSPTELDLSCHRCSAEPISISYKEEHVYLICPSCEGILSVAYHGWPMHRPRGMVSRFPLSPAGTANRTELTLLSTSFINMWGEIKKHRAGVCSHCSGTIDSSLHVCDEHQASQTAVCPDCGFLDSVRVHTTCTACKNWSGTPVTTQILDHPSVVCFYHERGIDMRFDLDDGARFTEKWERFWAIDQRLISTDPVRIHITVPCNGDELRLTLDGSLDVIETSTSSA